MAKVVSIVKVDKDGNVVTRYSCVADAAKAEELSENVVRTMLKGERRILTKDECYYCFDNEKDIREAAEKVRKILAKKPKPAKQDDSRKCRRCGGPIFKDILSDYCCLACERADALGVAKVKDNEFTKPYKPKPLRFGGSKPSDYAKNQMKETINLFARVKI